MTDKITADELVTLAEFCGKQIYSASIEGVVISGGGTRVMWQPHIDANQRDEVVEAMTAVGCQVKVESRSGRHYGKVFHPERAGIYTGEPTPGEAVCWAALRVIGGEWY